MLPSGVQHDHLTVILEYILGHGIAHATLETVVVTGNLVPASQITRKVELTFCRVVKIL